jgi:hypothetical protein
MYKCLCKYGYICNIFSLRQKQQSENLYYEAQYRELNRIKSEN